MRRRPFFLLIVGLILVQALMVNPVRADTTVDSYSATITTGCTETGIAAGFTLPRGCGTCFSNIQPFNTQLTTAGITMRRTGTPTGNLFVRIYTITSAFCSTNDNDGPSTGLIGTSGAVDVSGLSTSFAIVNFVFTTGPVLTAGAYYWWVLWHETGAFDASNFFTIASGGTPAYARGQLCYATGSVSAPTCSNQVNNFMLFTLSSSASSLVNTCVGNCGATVQNTNSTKTINFNASITVFYQAQAALNGFIANFTTRAARTYTNGIRLYLAVYTVDPVCTATNQPFTAACPGFLRATDNFLNPAKGLLTVQSSVNVQAGQWIGIAVSASFAGLELNDTSITSTMYQAAGIMPAFISQYSTLGSRSTQLYATLIGFPATQPGTTIPPGCNSLTCSVQAFANALGGGTFGGLWAFFILFGVISVPLLYITRVHDEKGNIKGFMLPMEILAILGILLLVSLSVLEVLPVWIPVLIIVIVAWLFTDSFMGRRKGAGGGMG